MSNQFITLGVQIDRYTANTVNDELNKQIIAFQNENDFGIDTTVTIGIQDLSTRLFISSLDSTTLFGTSQLNFNFDINSITSTTSFDTLTLVSTIVVDSIETTVTFGQGFGFVSLGASPIEPGVVFGTPEIPRIVHRSLIFKDDNISKLGVQDAVEIASGIAVLPSVDKISANSAGATDLAVVVDGVNYKLPLLRNGNQGQIALLSDLTSVTANVATSTSPPSNPNTGDLWWATDEGQLYIYYDSYWVQAAESLATYANTLFSGSWNDLSDKPNLDQYLQVANVASLSFSNYLEVANASTVALTGSYNDLSDKPNLDQYLQVANSTNLISNLVEDTTPQLGGNLDLNGRNITGSGSILTTGVIQITGDVTANNLYSSLVAPQSGDLVLRSSYAGSASGARITLDGDNTNANIILDPFGSGIVDVQGALTATGDVTGYAFNGRIGSVTGTTVDASFYPVFVSSIQPDQYLEGHSGLTYNPSSGILTATRFNGGFAGTLAADLNAQSFAKIINLPTPTNPGDAASKNYVDNEIAGITGFATESYVNTYVNARTQDLADNRGVWVRNANFDVTTGDFNQVIPWDVALVTSTIPNFTMSSGVFTNTDSRTRRFLFQMHVAIRTLVTDFTEADIWFSYNATYSGSNRRGQVNATDVDGMPNVMLTTSWTFTLAQNETVRCYVWAQQTYRVGGSAFGNDRSCLVEVQELN